MVHPLAPDPLAHYAWLLFGIYIRVIISHL